MSVKSVSMFQLHFPDEVRVFSIPSEEILLWNDQVLVYEARMKSRVLRHYSFYSRWFEINCTLDLNGGFAPEPGPIDWCFNCDISTPCFSVADHFYSIDLELDVLVGSDGHAHHVKDRDDFAQAISEEWITDQERDGAEKGLEDLLGIIRGESLVTFLNQICPFSPSHVGLDCELEHPYEIKKMVEIPLFEKSDRQHRYGKRS